MCCFLRGGGCFNRTWFSLSPQLRARGCPAIIVGTHADKVDRPKIAQMEELAKKLYMNPDTAKCYPQVPVEYMYNCMCTLHVYVFPVCSHVILMLYMCYIYMYLGVLTYILYIIHM